MPHTAIDTAIIRGSIAAHQAAAHPQRHHQSTEAKHHQHVEDVAAHHVAGSKGDGITALEQRQHTHEQLGRTRAEGHHGESHHNLGNAQQQSQGRGTAHEQLTTGKQHHNPRQDRTNGWQRRHQRSGQKIDAVIQDRYV
jgi:hypothetical protein